VDGAAEDLARRMADPKRVTAQPAVAKKSEKPATPKP